MALHGRRRFAPPAFDAPSSSRSESPRTARPRASGGRGPSARTTAGTRVSPFAGYARFCTAINLLRCTGRRSRKSKRADIPAGRTGQRGGAGVGGDRGASARARGGDAGEAGSAGTELRSAAPIPRPWLTGRTSPRPVRLSVRVPLHAVSWRLPISNRLRTDRKITSRIRTGRRIGPERSPSRRVLRHPHV